MGRKKSKRVVLKKPGKEKISTSFACPFCNHEMSVECKLDRQRQIGTMSCRVCSAGYQTVINYLSEPVDVYGEWIDAIDAQEQKKQAARESLGADDTSEGDETGSRRPGRHTRAASEEDDEDKGVGRKRQQAQQRPAKKKKRTGKPVASDEGTEESEALFGSSSSSESEADFSEESD